MPTGTNGALRVDAPLHDDLLVQSAHVAHRLALEHCRHATGPDCTWYHGTWQYLRALGVSKTAGGHATFLTHSLRSLVAGGDVRRVLISGSADDAMTLIALEAFRDATVQPELTLIDLCETPLALSRWSAERFGGTVATHQTDILDYADDLAFDVVMSNSFLSYFHPAVRPRLFARWASLLRSGGKLLLTNRLRPGSPAAAIGFTADQAQVFCAAVRREAERRQDVVGLDPATVEGWARAYTERFKSFPLRSVDEVLELLRSAGFVPDRLDTALFPGLPGGEAVAGPSSSDRADYVRVLATRR
jgi:SAM-dependent methyltransferase